MNRKNYQEPELSVCELLVERGFAISDPYSSDVKVDDYLGGDVIDPWSVEP